ncbi:MAG TPA: hypothetical protein VFM31_10415 [Nitrososphaeraceae archaeon]|nr:hypothetical protein [Nitrososphaeraceae archaeon]
MKICYVDLEDRNLMAMSEMTKDEIRNFLLQGTFTGKLGTVNKNGRSHMTRECFLRSVINKNKINKIN